MSFEDYFLMSLSVVVNGKAKIQNYSDETFEDMKNSDIKYSLDESDEKRIKEIYHSLEFYFIVEIEIERMSGYKFVEYYE